MIARKRKRGSTEAKKNQPMGLRWPVERTSSWLSNFDNNEAEREVRMVKVQQKISGGLRTKTGAAAWLAVRSYLATVIKNGVNPLAALQRLTVADPWMPPAPDIS